MPPSTRGGSSGGGGGGGKKNDGDYERDGIYADGHTNANNGLVNTIGANNSYEESKLGAKDADSRTIHTQENNIITNNTTNESGDRTSTASSNERMIIDGKSTQHYDDTTRMVESWREEVYMMNVKNSILLDDMVKLGADV